MGDAGGVGELLVGAVQEPLDGLGAEDAVELGGQSGGRSPERQLLVERDVLALVQVLEHGVSSELSQDAVDRRSASPRTRWSRSRTAVSKAWVLPTGTGSGTDQCRAAVSASSSCARSQTVITRSPGCWTSTRSRGRVRLARWQSAPLGYGDGAWIDGLGGVSARGGSRDVAECMPQQGGELGPGGVGGTDEEHSGRNLNGPASECRYGVGHQLEVGAPPVALGTQPPHQSGADEHVEVMGQQVAADAQLSGQVRGESVTGGQLLDDAQPHRVTEGGEDLGSLLDRPN